MIDRLALWLSLLVRLPTQRIILIKQAQDGIRNASYHSGTSTTFFVLGSALVVYVESVDPNGSIVVVGINVVVTGITIFALRIFLRPA